MRILIEFSAVDERELPWDPDVLYLLDNELYAAIVKDPEMFVIKTVRLDANSLGTNHTSIMSIQGLTNDTSFEFQLIQHFEGPPTSAS